jgi:glycosyltransferase involved in cell wall biosynthesis
MTVPAAPGSRPWRIVLVELTEDGSVGGSHRCLVDLVHNLDRQEFTPVVVFHQANPYLDELRAEGVEVHLLGSRSYPASVYPSRLQRLLRKGRVIRDRIAFLRGVKADLVHLNNSPQNGCDDWLPAAGFCRLPCITHARGFPWGGTGVLTTLLSRRFDRVITISRCVNEAWQAEGIPASRTRQIYDGVDTQSVRARVRRDPAEARAELGLRPDLVVIAMIGHIKAWKGQDVVLSALALLSRAQRERLHVLFVGGRSDSEGDTYSERLRVMVREAGLGPFVSFLGPRRDAPDLMNAADIVVHASTTPEPLGLVVLEGMVLGKPVVASRLGGPGEIVQPGAGLLFDPARPEELARALADLSGDPARRRALGEGGRSLAREFGIERNVRAIEGIYRELLRPS